MILKENLVQCVVLHGFLFCKSYLHAQIHTVHTISKPLFGSPVLVKRVCNHGRCMAAGMQHWVKQGHATFYTRIQIGILCCTFSLSHWMIPQQQGGCTSTTTTFLTSVNSPSLPLSVCTSLLAPLKLNSRPQGFRGQSYKYIDHTTCRSTATA
jgi:hypothetical protein